MLDHIEATDGTRPSRLLLVDDDPDMLVALSATIYNRLDDCRVDACESGMQALEQVKATPPYDTIISDVMMPGMDGWEFLRAAKKYHRDTPVFLMSGIAEPTVKKRALDAGATAFLAKPFDRDAFVATVRHGLELFRLNRLLAMEDAGDAPR